MAIYSPVETAWHVTSKELPAHCADCYLAVQYTEEEELFIMPGYYNQFADKFFSSVNHETFRKEQVRFWTAQIETPDIAYSGE